MFQAQCYRVNLSFNYMSSGCQLLFYNCKKIMALSPPHCRHHNLCRFKKFIKNCFCSKFRLCFQTLKQKKHFRVFLFRLKITHEAHATLNATSSTTASTMTTTTAATTTTTVTGSRSHNSF